VVESEDVQTKLGDADIAFPIEASDVPDFVKDLSEEQLKVLFDVFAPYIPRLA